MRRWMVGVMVSTVLLAGACGSDSNEGGAPPVVEKKSERSPAELVAAAANLTPEAKSFKVAFSVSVKGALDAPAGSQTLTGEGVFDYTNRVGVFTLTLPGMSDVKAVMTGNTMYQRYPDGYTFRLGGKPWVKMDLPGLTRISGVHFRYLAQTLQSDASQAIQLLRGAGADMAEVGKEQLRGVNTTRYRGTLDLNKAAASAPPEQKASLQAVAELYSGQIIPMEVWLDAEGRLRKIVQAVDASKINRPTEPVSAPKPTGFYTLSMELYDFGTPVNAVAPPAGQVTEFAQLISRIVAQGGQHSDGNDHSGHGH